MRVCPACGAEHTSPDWACPACGHVPEAEGAILRLAPELEAGDDGFDPELFAALAEVEDRSFWFRARNDLIARTLAEHFPDARSLLEVGCGTGYVLTRLRAERPDLELLGGEMFTEGLRHAAPRLPGTQLLQLDARALPFHEALDVVCAFDVLEHVDEHEAVMASMAAATRPGGGVMVTVPQHPFLWSRADDAAHHRRRYRRRELLALVRGAGLRVERVTSFVTTLFPLMALNRIVERRRAGDFDPIAELRATTSNPVLDAAMRLDLALIGRGVSLPFGGSLLVVAVKP